MHLLAGKVSLRGSGKPAELECPLFQLPAA